MSKVLFDAIATQGTKNVVNSGGAEYAKFVLRELLARSIEFDVVFNTTLISDPAIEELVTTAQGVNIHYVANKQELYRLINDGGYDIFYSALPYGYGDYSCSAHLVGVIHGLRDIEITWDQYKHKFYNSLLKRFIGYVISKSDLIQRYLKQRRIENMSRLLSLKEASFITVSQHSKYALLNFYPDLKPENIEVFYSPFEVEIAPQNRERGDYYLMVSANRFEKNIYRAIKSFDKLFSDGRLEGKRVVITGCNATNFMSEIENRSRFELLPYVSNTQLEELYRDAFCFVYPSLNEGFGYPPLKAMSYDVPVIASSSTSIPEVCQDSAVIFSPLSCDDLCNRILQVEYDTDLRSSLQVKGQRRVQELLNMQQANMDSMINFIFKK